MNDLPAYTFDRISQWLRRAGCLALGCLLAGVLLLCTFCSAVGYVLLAELNSH